MGVEIVAIGPSGVTLKSGEEILATTVVWCAGMRANPLTRLFPVEHDHVSRILVDAFMRVKDVANVFAADDVAWAMMDDRHASIMSCRHGRPMGRFAGNNVVCDLFGLPMLPLRIVWYVTVLDLGSWGAVYTEGWDRQVVTKGEAAEEDQAGHQLPANLSAVDRESPGDPRGGRAGGAAAARNLSLVQRVQSRRLATPMSSSSAPADCAPRRRSTLSRVGFETSSRLVHRHLTGTSAGAPLSLIKTTNLAGFVLLAFRSTT